MRSELSTHVKRVKVYALSKIVGFLRALRIPPTGKVDRVGWVIWAHSSWLTLLWCPCPCGEVK